MIEWSEALGGVPIHLHEADRKWIMRGGSAIQLWQGETKELAPGLTLIRCGGHYPGGQVLHWPAGAGGKGALLSGDIVQVVADNKSVSFMWSFPNFIPLSAPRVEGVVKALAPYAFDRVHGAFAERTIWADGKAVVERSAAELTKGSIRFGRALSEDHPRRRLLRSAVILAVIPGRREAPGPESITTNSAIMDMLELWIPALAATRLGRNDNGECTQQRGQSVAALPAK
jgi:hypothetical protein